MTDPAEIARGLTKAQRDAVVGVYSWTSPWDEQEGEQALYRLGIWKSGRLKRGESIMTPLGLAVRKHIKEADDAL